MADLATEMQYLAEADVRLELIRRQIVQQENLLREAQQGGMSVSGFERTLAVLHRTESAFLDHCAILRETVRRLERQR